MPLPTAISPKSEAKRLEKNFKVVTSHATSLVFPTFAPLFAMGDQDGRAPTFSGDGVQTTRGLWRSLPVLVTTLNILLPTAPSQTDDVQLSHVHVDFALTQPVATMTTIVKQADDVIQWHVRHIFLATAQKEK